jgi:Protein of unknown function (DUF3037)
MFDGSSTGDAMIKKQKYSYTALRYVHDVMTGEFVNVGVVLFVPSTATVKVKTRSTIGRIKDIFPDLQRVAFVNAMRTIDRGIKKVSKDCAETSLLSRDVDAGALARMALPSDDSSLQWSPVGGGLTDDVDKTFERLFERLVSRYDAAHSAHRRTDDDVWRPVRAKIAERNIDVELVKKTIVGSTDEIAFEHAWKNGKWHAYEPISLDMADADGIKDKARRWRGHLDAVHDGASEQVKLHLVIGAPSQKSLIPAYENAVKILSSSPFQPTIYSEDQIDELVNQFEDEVRAHVAVRQ